MGYQLVERTPKMPLDVSGTPVFSDAQELAEVGVIFAKHALALGRVQPHLQRRDERLGDAAPQTAICLKVDW